MDKKIRKCGGWTLIELAIAIAIFTVLSLALTALYATGDALMQISQNKLSLQQQARLSLDRVLKELRLANPGSVAINQNQNSITFQIPQSIDQNSGAITWAPAITYSVGGINNAQLIRTQQASANIIMANDVNDNLQDANRLRFVPDQTPNPNLVTITMGLRRTTLKGHVAVTTLTGEAKLRNP